MPSATQPAARTEKEAPNTSRLLELPAELRNTIYELAFTTDYDDKEEIDLLSAEPPSKDLLLVCHQIYNEAGQIYRDKYRTFWSTGRFVLEPRDHQGFNTRLASLDSTDVENVGSLSITGQSANFTLLDKRGGWLVQLADISFYAWLGYDAGGKRLSFWRLSESELREKNGFSSSYMTLHKILLDSFSIVGEKSSF